MGGFFTGTGSSAAIPGRRSGVGRVGDGVVMGGVVVAGVPPRRPVVSEGVVVPWSVGVVVLVAGVVEVVSGVVVDPVVVPAVEGVVDVVAETVVVTELPEERFPD
ncbi:MAG: hypothetical protein Q7S02_02375 [bacterium]|nr:hypothetical protein [bacterium]